MSKKDLDINCERGCIFGKDIETDEPIATLTHGGFKLNSVDWIEEIKSSKVCKLYEVRFKNTRKAFFENVNNLPLKIGDIVAVEGNPGHDIGIISMCEDMVKKQMRAKRFNPANAEFKKIYRIAKPYDIERWQEAISLEHPTMIKSRQIAAKLNLNMKIGDVEYQGDRIKAIFYYIADERVDFRELIKILADEFKIRIEMKQIGARQEAGRIGGIGSCGRELCCSSFVTNFVSVTTNSARFQDILLNPQKLAGQCGKLKCCLNFEVDSYIDARKGLPKVNGPLQTLTDDYYLVKTDIFKGEMTFSTDPHLFVNTKVLSADTVKEIISLNRRGIKVEELISETVVADDVAPDYKNVVGDDSITRFDKKIIKKNKKRKPFTKQKPNGENQAKVATSGDATNDAPRQRRDNPRRQNSPRTEDGRNQNLSTEQRSQNNDNREQRQARPQNNGTRASRPQNDATREQRPQNDTNRTPRPQNDAPREQRPQNRNNNNRRFNKRPNNNNSNGGEQNTTAPKTKE